MLTHDYSRLLSLQEPLCDPGTEAEHRATPADVQSVGLRRRWRRIVHRHLLPLRSVVVRPPFRLRRAISVTDRRRIYSHGIFQTRPVPVEFFFIPLTFALGLLLYVFPYPLRTRLLPIRRSSVEALS